MSRPGGVKYFHLLNTTETVDKRRATWLVKDLAYNGLMVMMMALVVKGDGGDNDDRDDDDDDDGDGDNDNYNDNDDRAL